MSVILPIAPDETCPALPSEARDEIAPEVLVILLLFLASIANEYRLLCDLVA